MKLDRNTNRGGHGKYALVNMRKLIPLIDKEQPTIAEQDAVACFDKLVMAGIITLGNESPGDQFFVMKYKDMFTADGLTAYAMAVQRYALDAGVLGDGAAADSLKEYAQQMFQEAKDARELGNRIPD